MNSIKDIYRIGHGPSSSHTIAPARAAELFLKEFGLLDKYVVELYGSLSLTGKGHHTDLIIQEIFKGRAEFIFDNKFDDQRNSMIFNGYKDGKLVATWHAESLGGGAIHIDEKETDDNVEFYKERNFNEIKEVLAKEDINLWQYVLKNEPEIKYQLRPSFDVMIASVERGLQNEGVLNERLNVKFHAKGLYEKGCLNYDNELKIMAYAYAAAEENALGHIVSTAPTLGSCGIVAGLMYYYYKDLNRSIDKLLEALAVGGVFGNIIKQNASISGALGGCQAEVGTACAMASAMIAYLEGADTDVIEYAAEIGIEHHLGLTCDPVFGLVIIPCIERNAAAIIRSFNAYKLSKNLTAIGEHLVTFDMVVSSMHYTGKKISPELKETSLGGLALEFKDE